MVFAFWTWFSPSACSSNQVARIKLGEISATDIGECLKAKSAFQAQKAGKVPINLGPQPPSGADNKKVKHSL